MKKIELKASAMELYGKITQLSGVLELENDFRSIQARTRAETAAKILQEMPDNIDESMIKLVKKILFECRQGLTAFKPHNNFDQSLKDEAIKIIDLIDSLEK